MRYDVEVDGRIRQVTVMPSGDLFAVSIDGHTWQVNAVRTGAHGLSLIVDTSVPAQDARRPGPLGRSYDVTIAPDPTARQLTVHVGAVPVRVVLNSRGDGRVRDEAGTAGSGPQRITAPMPGRIARVLVARGQAVAGRQPLVVVEAMKMENELRAERAGAVAEVRVAEGDSVDAGTLLIVIQ